MWRAAASYLFVVAIGVAVPYAVHGRVVLEAGVRDAFTGDGWKGFLGDLCLMASLAWLLVSAGAGLPALALRRFRGDSPSVACSAVHLLLATALALCVNLMFYADYYGLTWNLYERFSSFVLPNARLVVPALLLAAAVGAWLAVPRWRGSRNDHDYVS